MTPALYQFHVPGLPRPKGSIRFVPVISRFPTVVQSAKDLQRCGRLTSTTDGLQDWQRAISWAAFAARGNLQPSQLCGYDLSVIFKLPKPKRLRFAKPIVRPDLDKLLRAVCDALTGVLWHDDSQVLLLSAEKVYVDNVANIGALITVTQVATEATFRKLAQPPRRPRQTALPLIDSGA